MEIFATTYACSPVVGTWTAHGLGVTGGARVTAPISRMAKGTGVSIASRTRTTTPVTTKATALLPISDVVVFNDIAGIRSWSPPV